MKFRSLYTLTWLVVTDIGPSSREYSFLATSERVAVLKSQKMLADIDAVAPVLVNVDAETKSNLLDANHFLEYPLITSRDMVMIILYWIVFGLTVAGIFWLALGRAGGVG